MFVAAVLVAEVTAASLEADVDSQVLHGRVTGSEMADSLSGKQITHQLKC